MTQTLPATSTSSGLPPPKLSGRRGLPRMQELGLLVVIVLLYVVLGIAGSLHAKGTQSNAFLNFERQFNGIATYMSIYAIMAVGMTAVIITGGIDISVGSILGLSALATAHVVQTFDPHAAWYTVLPVALVVTEVPSLALSSTKFWTFTSLWIKLAPPEPPPPHPPPPQPPPPQPEWPPPPWPPPQPEVPPPELVPK